MSADEILDALADDRFVSLTHIPGVGWELRFSEAGEYPAKLVCRDLDELVGWLVNFSRER